jgi:uncharacterized RDD family membrane protein YckC
MHSVGEGWTPEQSAVILGAISMADNVYAEMIDGFHASRQRRADRPSALLDTRYTVETPENIELEADVAGPVVRGLAYAFDFLVRTLILLVASLLMGLMGKAGWGPFLVLSFLLEWFYPVYFEAFRGGQTPGKKQFGLLVVNADLSPVGLGNSVIRNLLRAADFLPFFFLGGLVSMTMNRHFQRLGDLGAGTLVVYVRTLKRPHGLPEVAARMPRVTMTLDEQAALVNFSQRHKSLSKARQQELAGLVPSLAGSQEEQQVERLQGVGNWLLGDRRR